MKPVNHVQQIRSRVNAWRRARRQRGQVLVIMALGFVALTGMTGLAIDGGRVYMQQARMQNAADGGTSSGTYLLATKWNGSQIYTTSSAVQTAVDQTAHTNGLSVSKSTTVEYIDKNQHTLAGFGATARGVRVTTADPIPTTFLRIFGVSTLPASAKAQGLFGPPSQLPNVFPLVISANADILIDGKDFWFQPPGAGGDCSGAQCVNYEMLANLPAWPSPAPLLNLKVGDKRMTVATDNPSVSTATKNYIQSMIAADTTGSSCTNVIMPNSRVVFIPQSDSNFSAPPENKEVLKFRAFMFTSVSNSKINGCWVAVNDFGGTIDPSLPYTGVTTMSLVPPT